MFVDLSKWKGFIKMPSAPVLQKIGATSIYLVVGGFILFKILDWSSPIIKKHLTASKNELKTEIISSLESRIDSLEKNQKDFYSIFIIKLDSTITNQKLLILKLNKHSQAIVNLIESSNMNNDMKFDEVVNLLSSTNEEIPIVRPNSVNTVPLKRGIGVIKLK